MFRSPFYPAPLAHYNCTFHTVFTLNYTWLAHLFTPLDDDSETTSPSTVFVRKGVQLYDFSLPLPLFWASTLPQSTRHLVEVIPTIGCFQPPVDWRLKQHDIYVPTHKDDIGENYPLLNYNPRFPLEPLKTTEWGNKLISPFFITPSVPTSTLDQLTSIPQANMNNNYMYSTLHNLHRPPLVNTLVTDFPQLSSIFRQAKNLVFAFAKKIRRVVTPLSVKLFSRCADPAIDDHPRQHLDFFDYSYWSMRRIRFKPGISRIWRAARRDLKVILDFPVRYQHRLTWRLTKLSRVREMYTLPGLLHQLQYLIIRFRFAFDLITSLQLVAKGLIFLNGRLCLRGSTYLTTNDRLNIIVSWEYYVTLFRPTIPPSLPHPFWFKLIQRHSLRAHYRIGKVWKASSATNKFNHLAFIWDDTPPFFQIDFFSLSCVILRECPPLPASAIGAHFHSPIHILNVYNWKYIT